MKRILALCMLVLLSACGMGGSENTSTPGLKNATEVQPDGATGKVDVSISESVAKTVAAVPVANNMRLVITNPSLSINGSSFKYIIDGTMPAGNKVTGLRFPIARGYTFELVTYNTLPVGVSEITVNRILKYAKVSNISVGITDTSVDLNLQAVAATFALPSETVYSGATLGAISAQFISQPTPLQSAWNLFLKTDASQINTALHSVSGQSTTHTLVKAPYVLVAGALYGQGEFYINNSLLDTAGTLTILDPNTLASKVHQAEKNTDWTFNFPNPDFGESVDLVKTALDVRGIDINIVTGAAQ